MDNNFVRPTEIILLENSSETALDIIEELYGKGFYCNIYICETIEKLISIIFRQEEFINFTRPEIILINEQLYVENKSKIDDKIKYNNDFRDIKVISYSAGEEKINEDSLEWPISLDKVRKAMGNQYVFTLSKDIINKDIENEEIKILVIEDNPRDLRLMKEYFSEIDDMNIDILQSETLKDGIDILKKGKIDIVFLDLNISDSSGFDTYVKIKDLGLMVPIIVLTGLDDKETALKAIQEGAQEYILKDNIDSSVLKKAIRYSIERNKVIKEFELNTQYAVKKKKNLEQLMNAVNIGIIAVNRYDKIEYANFTAGKLLGIDNNEMLGRNIMIRYELNEELRVKYNMAEYKTFASPVLWDEEPAVCIIVEKIISDSGYNILENKIDAVIAILNNR